MRSAYFWKKGIFRQFYIVKMASGHYMLTKFTGLGGFGYTSYYFASDISDLTVELARGGYNFDYETLIIVFKNVFKENI